jgi:TetR/AcrR family transcriptional regulator, transcriptional repressor for nem operon
MMAIIDGDAETMRYPAEETAAKDERIVKEASRLFRERGFENVTVAEVMKAAGLTHGAFYAHFGDRNSRKRQLPTGRRFRSAVREATVQRKRAGKPTPSDI